ncbi:MAG: hypothetical protein J6D06_05385 [Clostridia bacterium]|nr:hypothetical protein [Clostridia bacterium]
MKRKIFKIIKLLPSVAGVVMCITGLLLYPTETAGGIKDGLLLTANNLIPSLFPFMVLSSYLVESSVSDVLAKITNRFSSKVFKTNGYGMCAVIMSFIGGYPIGAKITADFYKNGKLTKNQAQSLLLWSVNPGFAFVILAVGSFMYARIKIGIILYISLVISALITGLAVSFFTKRTYSPPVIIADENKKNLLVEAVNSSGKSMLTICGWVLIFSAAGALFSKILPPSGAIVFRALAEVTTGCRTAAEANLPLPITCGILGFGGFAVFFQITEYLQQCSLNPKLFFCTRLINGALAAFVCSELLKVFPEATPASTSVTINNVAFPLYHSVASAIILIFMLILLILEVDNKRKMC